MAQRDVDTQERLRQMELEIGRSAPSVPPSVVQTHENLTAPNTSWGLAKILGVSLLGLLALGLVMRLLGLAVQIALVVAVGYGVYRWFIAPRLKNVKPFK